MYQFDTEIRVRYGETDQMQVLYYGFYAWYYEVGRVEALRNLGISYKEIEEKGSLLVVSQMHSKFIQSARYDDLLTIRSIVPIIPKLGLITFDTEIYREDDLIHTGNVRLVCVDREKRTVKSVPSEITNALKPYFESGQE